MTYFFRFRRRLHEPEESYLLYTTGIDIMTNGRAFGNAPRAGVYFLGLMADALEAAWLLHRRPPPF